MSHRASLKGLKRCNPAMLAAASEAFPKSVRDLDFLGEDAIVRCPSVAFPLPFCQHD